MRAPALCSRLLSRHSYVDQSSPMTAKTVTPRIHSDSRPKIQPTTSRRRVAFRQAPGQARGPPRKKTELGCRLARREEPIGAVFAFLAIRFFLLGAGCACVGLGEGQQRPDPVAAEIERVPVPLLLFCLLFDFLTEPTRRVSFLLPAGLRSWKRPGAPSLSTIHSMSPRCIKAWKSSICILRHSSLSACSSVLPSLVCLSFRLVQVWARTALNSEGCLFDYQKARWQRQQGRSLHNRKAGGGGGGVKKQGGGN
jgi:hypothetical protein